MKRLLPLLIFLMTVFGPLCIYTWAQHRRDAIPPNSNVTTIAGQPGPAGPPGIAGAPGLQGPAGISIPAGAVVPESYGASHSIAQGMCATTASSATLTQANNL